MTVDAGLARTVRLLVLVARQTHGARARRFRERARYLVAARARAGQMTVPIMGCRTRWRVARDAIGIDGMVFGVAVGATDAHASKRRTIAMARRAAHSLVLAVNERQRALA